MENIAVLLTALCIPGWILNLRWLIKDLKRDDHFSTTLDASCFVMTLFLLFPFLHRDEVITIEVMLIMLVGGTVLLLFLPFVGYRYRDKITQILR